MIGIFGSAFNPPSLGHKDALIQAAKHCEKILLLPSASHAFGKDMLPYEIRYHMVSAFARDIQSDVTCPIEVSSLEQEMASEGISPIYTFDVLDRLETELGTNQLAFILGPDNANPDTWARFYKHQEIDQRWQKLICKEQQAIRSTLIREKVAEGADTETLFSLTTPSVIELIRTNNLYRPSNKVN